MTNLGGRAASVLMAADIRFPLERANGVQIVKSAHALAALGTRTTLVVRQSDPRLTPDVLALYGLAPLPALEVRRLPVGHRRGANHLPRLFFLVQAAAAAMRAASAGAAVYTRDLQLAEALLRVPTVRRVLVYEAHAVESLMYVERDALYGTGEKPDEKKRVRLHGREGRVWRGAAAIVATTGGIRDTFAEMYGARERVHVVPNGCDVPEGRVFTPPPRGARPRVVYAGQLYPWKGVDVLVEAVAALPEVELLILGGLEGEKDLRRVRERVLALGLRERVQMPGTVPQAQVAAELERASIVAVPFLQSVMTARHTSPLKAFEALAAGRPLVATDLPSSREVLEDGVNALLVPPGDAAALAAGLRRLLQDEALALRLARAAFDAAPRYAWSARAQKVQQVLAELPA